VGVDLRLLNISQGLHSTICVFSYVHWYPT